ncbi:MAG TPA: divalent cation tolerance protein CutA [Nitrosopumilaceae archaeon]|nr:divalent cation tolerance protein CutA [Nitrosopumilaceae archaeon]
MILFLVRANLSVAMGAVIIISTYPNKKSILKIANMLVKENLAGCVNFMKINSIYTWQNKLENTAEILAFFKTTDKKKKLLKDKIKKSHPYKVPEIAELKVTSINKPYLDWLVTSTN